MVIYFMLKYPNHIKKILATSITISTLIPCIVNYVHGYDIITRHYPELVLDNKLLIKNIMNNLILDRYINVCCTWSSGILCFLQVTTTWVVMLLESCMDIFFITTDIIICLLKRYITKISKYRIVLSTLFRFTYGYGG